MGIGIVGHRRKRLDGAQLTLMRRDLKRAIDEYPLRFRSLIEWSMISKELNDRLFGRQRRTLLNDVSAIG
jgi:hypothetical protein